jgi:mRNA degradation ribonuclease J1/J2
LVPIHGDRTMLEAHAATAWGLGIPALVVENGEALQLSSLGLERGRTVRLHPRALDVHSGAQIPPDLLQLRRKLGARGVVFLFVPFVGDLGALRRPRVVCRGFEVPEALPRLVADFAADCLLRLDERQRLEWKSHIRTEVRRLLERRLGVRPVIEIEAYDLASSPDSD